jgi:Domain of unknown function (DUF4349)
LVLSWTAACMGHGDAEAWTPDPEPQAATTANLQPRTHAPTIPAGRVHQDYYNIEMNVPNPAQAADAVRTLAHDVGGEVTNLNADGSNGSLTAALEPATADRFRHALTRIPGTIVRENSSSNDITAALEQLDERLTKLERAEAEMDRLMRATTDRALFDAWVTQRELNTRERENLHNQVSSYLQTVRRTQVTVTFTSAPAAPAAAGNFATALGIDRRH